MTKLTMDATTARNKIMDEMTMAKSLASNHLSERQAAMERLRIWLSNEKEDFTEEDYLRLWKGLFYCMWMSDKPLVQEELANEISSLIHAPPSYESSLLFIRTFYLTMVVEWFGIDHHRIDKFMMLVRRFLRHSFELVRKKKWAKEEVDKFSEEIFFILKFLRKGPLGLITHVKDIYVEELAKVSRGKIPAERVAKLLEPFARFIGTVDTAVLHKLTQKVFSHIIKQSEHGLEHQLKVVAWKRMGFPPNKFNKIKRLRKEDLEEDDSDADLIDDKSDSEIDEGEDEVSQFQDLRAGGDVVIPTMDFDPQVMVDMLNRVRELEETTKKGKGRIQAIIQLFQRLLKGRYPLVTNQIRAVDSRKLINLDDEVDKATQRLAHIRNLKDEDAVKAYYAMKQKPVPSDDILLAGDGRRQREWVEKHEYNDSIYLFGKNQVKNTSGTWTVTPKLAENGIDNDPAVIKNQQVINAHEAIATSLRKKRKLEKDDKSEDLDNFPMEDEDKTDSPTKAKKKKKNTKQVLACAPISNTSKASDGTPKKDKSKKKEKTPLKTPPKSSTSSPPILPLSSPEKSPPASPVKHLQVSLETMSPKSLKKLRKSLKGTPSKESCIESVETPNATPTKAALRASMKVNMKNILRTPVNTALAAAKNETPKSEKRRVEFVLTKNCSQDPKEYRRSLKLNPGIPFSAEKKPTQGVLKASPFPSPVNPFVKRSNRNKRLSF